MRNNDVTPEQLGREVFGPIFAEFCLRLHMVASFMALQRPDDGVLLFCARGGLRMQLGWDRFLAAAALPEAMPSAALMVSRLAAIRPALVRTVADDMAALAPSVARTVEYEFGQSDLASTVRALTGITPDGDQSAPATSAGLASLLRSPDGARAAAALVEQSRLFTRHFDEVRGDRSMPVLVDTGLFGTTRAVIAAAYPNLDVRSLLLARALRPDLVEHQRGTFGLSVEAEVYSFHLRRSALMRYWHLIEWLFEPNVASVKSFTETSQGVRSNLEVAGWQDRIEGDCGSVFAGVLEYVDGISPGSAAGITANADLGWAALRRALVWPTPEMGRALAVGTRSHDFGRDGTWEARTWRGPIDALRSSTMWREGEIARSGGAWRLPLQAAIEIAHGLRGCRRAVTFRQRFRS